MSSKKYHAPAVKKAFQILRIISRADRGVGITALSRNLGISKSTVHGITSALEDLGVIIRDPSNKGYRAGFTLMELGRLAYAQIALKDVARPFMEELMEKTDESVFLGVLNAGHITILDIIESRQDLKITSPIGTTIPIFAGAVGKVFLASMEESQVKAIIRTRGLPAYTENSITDEKRYLREIGRVRQKGYAVDYEEYIAGVRAIAVPIRGENRPVSAIWVVGFKASLSEDKMAVFIEETRSAAAAISRLLERDPDDHPQNLA